MFRLTVAPRSLGRLGKHICIPKSYVDSHVASEPYLYPLDKFARGTLLAAIYFLPAVLMHDYPAARLLEGPNNQQPLK
ncbi:hypothetical protein F5X96DRAFT_674399 [Biscogniauxia mediterranea]|nr:hypothetical protein F5X96DRAFT_674399 [Biscogniauxia mediterranea]